MGRMLDLLKPVPHIEEIKDKDLLDKTYTFWRFRIFYSMFIGYIFYYFSRKSLVFAMPVLIQDLGFSKSELGILVSILSLSYAVSKFASGIFADRSNPRYFMAMGLFTTGLCNIFFGLSSSIWFFALFWGLNGLFQGFGWPPCARYLTHWYSHNERGRWWAVWNTSHNIGGFSIAIVSATCAQAFGWRYALYIPGLLCIAVGFFLINRLRDSPQSLGLPPIEKYRDDYADESHRNQDQEKELSVKEVLFTYVLTNKFIWVLAFANLFVYILRTAVNDWSILFLTESKNYSHLLAGSCICWFEVGGFCGNLAAGWMSDKVFKGRRGPVNVLFSSGVLGTIIFFQFIPAGYYYLDALSMYFTGFFIFGPQMLVGVAATELSHKKAAATASGFTGLFGYVGAALAGFPLGLITDKWGWDGFFTATIACAVISLLLLIPLWSIKVYKEPSEPTVPVDSGEEVSYA
jgi:OPA family sugar phosphate sensor protein UhpC-like MFS transporter